MANARYNSASINITPVTNTIIIIITNTNTTIISIDFLYFLIWSSEIGEWVNIKSWVATGTFGVTEKQESVDS